MLHFSAACADKGCPFCCVCDQATTFRAPFCFLPRYWTIHVFMVQQECVAGERSQGPYPIRASTGDSTLPCVFAGLAFQIVSSGSQFCSPSCRSIRSLIPKLSDLKFLSPRRCNRASCDTAAAPVRCASTSSNLKFFGEVLKTQTR